MADFVKKGLLPADLKAQGFVGESLNLSCLLSEADADKVVERILALAEQNRMGLTRVSKRLPP